MATLTGTTIQSTYDSLLKVTDNDAITSTLKRITDGLGNNTPLYLSSSAVEITSTLNVLGNITGSNLSGTNTGDETKASIETKLGAASASNSGYLTSSDWSTFNNKIAGSGTLNRVTKFSSTGSIADSNITDNGTLVSISTATTITGNLTATNIIRSGGTSSQFLKADGSIDSTSYQPLLTNPITGSLTTNYIPKATGSTSLGNSLIFDNGTNVAIGTTTPGAALDVYKATGESNIQLSSGTEYLRIFYRDTDDNAGLFINGLTRLRFIGSAGNAAILESGTGNFAVGTSAATATTKLWVAGTGYFSDSVGIGSTSLTGFNLRVSKTITGATTSYGIASLGTVQSDVTSNVFNFISQSNTAAAAFTLGSYTHYYAQQNSIGAGSSITNQYGFLVESSITGATNNYGFFGNIASGTGRWNLYMNGTANNYLAGSLGIGSTSLASQNLRISRAITGAGTSIGVIVDGAVQSDVTTAQGFATNISTQAATFSPFIGHFVAQQSTIGAGSTPVDQYGFLAQNSLIGATNNYGFFGNIASATGRWNLYMAGTANNYLAGSLGIGTTSLTGVNLNVNKAITGGTTAYGMILSGAVQSDVTGNARLFYTNPSTQAAAFTVNQLVHYYANQGTIGAGSAVTIQTGFLAEGTLIGAGTNYGFRGTIPSGNNRWNLYMDGTANNLINGSVGIGTTTLTGYNLALGKTITGAGTSIAVYQTGQVQSDVTASAFGFRNDLNTQAATFTLPVYTHYQAQQGTVGAGTTLTTQIGFSAGTFTSGTNVFGFRGQVAAASGRWNLYMDGTANNYLAGSLGIGSTALTGYNLRVSKTITGATTSYGILSDGTVQSDVTANVYNYASQLRTQAASFNIGTYFHYFADQTSIGAGNTIVNQYGFVAQSTMIGATNNFGFTGAIPAGTNRWNLYMQGTAQNFLQGNTGIGITTPASALHIDRGNATESYLQFTAGTTTGQTATDGFDIGINASGNAILNQQENLDMIFSTNNTERMRITSGGNVGIGTSSPISITNYTSTTINGTNGGILQIQQGGNNSLRLIGEGTDAYIDNLATGALLFRTTSSATERMRITSGGNVGIGNTSPNHRLQITQAVDGNNPVLGTGKGALFIAGDTNLYGLYTGINTGSGNAYMQVMRNDSATAYNLLLQPAGGSVGIGTSTFTYAGATFATVLASSTSRAAIFNGSANSSVWWAGSGSPQFAIDSISGGGASFWVNNGSWSERIRLNASGNLLVNTSSDNNTGARLQVTGGITYQNLFNRVTTNYTLALTDQNDIVETNVASANTVTVPFNTSVDFPIGTEIAIMQYGAGQTSIVAASGVSIRSKNNNLKIADQYTGATLVKVAANEWYLVGNLTA